jgi:hypothetical protein
MRFHFSYILTGVALMSLLTGCIKDNNNIKSLVIQNPGIGFPYGANNKNDFIIRPSASAQQVPGLLLVTLEAAAPASSDIHITVADNSTALVNAYNSANGTAIQPLPRALWSIPSQLIIKAGDQFVLGDITITNTLGLNANQQFAVGLTITAADGGNKIADNLKNLFIVFRIQNALDGKYRMKGEFYHPTVEPAFMPHDFTIELHTLYGNSASLYWPLSSGYSNGYNGFGYNTPYTINGGVPTWGFLGIYGLVLNTNPFNPNVNPNDIIVYHDTPPAYDAWFFRMDSCNGKLYHNRVDTVTKTIYIAFGYRLGYYPTSQTSYFVPGDSRAWIDTLTYIGPR